MNPEDIRKEMKNFVPEDTNKPIEKKKKVLPEKKAKHIGYFEGELHLRNVTPEVLSYVAKRIYGVGEHIAKEKRFDAKNVDYWVSSRSLLRRLGKELQQKFGGEITAGETLFTRDHLTSKNVYRLNVCYRHHERVSGEIVAISGEPWKIMSFKGKRIIVEHILTGKRKNITQELAEKPLQKYRSHVVQTDPEIHILDPEFQSVVAKSAGSVNVDQKVKAVEIDGVWFIV